MDIKERDRIIDQGKETDNKYIIKDGRIYFNPRDYVYICLMLPEEDYSDAYIALHKLSIKGMVLKTKYNMPFSKFLYYCIKRRVIDERGRNYRRREYKEVVYTDLSKFTLSTRDRPYFDKDEYIDNIAKQETRKNKGPKYFSDILYLLSEGVPAIKAAEKMGISHTLLFDKLRLIRKLNK